VWIKVPGLGGARIIRQKKNKTQRITDLGRKTRRRGEGTHHYSGKPKVIPSSLKSYVTGEEVRNWWEEKITSKARDRKNGKGEELGE